MSFIFLALMASAAQAGSACTNVQVAAMARIPVANQADSPNCHAFAGAQMVDAWRFSNPGAGGDSYYDHLTSPEAVTLDTQNMIDEDKLPDGAHVCDAVAAIRTEGSCDDRAIPFGFKETHFIPAMALLKATYDNARKFANDADMQTELVLGLDYYLRKSVHMQATDVPSQEDLVKLLGESHPMTFLRGIMARGCTPEHRLMTKPPKCNAYRPAHGVSTDKLWFGINSALDRANPQPAAISYCSQILRKGRAFTGGVVEGKATKECHKHVSLVVGRREQALPGGAVRCQLLVRNSWGLRTKRYSPDWEIEQGNIWVDSDSLIANAYGVSYLE